MRELSLDEPQPMHTLPKTGQVFTQWRSKGGTLLIEYEHVDSVRSRYKLKDQYEAWSYKASFKETRL